MDEAPEIDRIVNELNELRESEGSESASTAQLDAWLKTLIAHGGSQATAVLVGTLVLTFAIGATLSGAVFILTEDH